MNSKIHIITILLFLITIHIMGRNINDSLTLELTKTVNNRIEYVHNKEEKIKTFISLLKPNVNKEQQYSINNTLYEEYRKFRIDSAILYAKYNLEVAYELKQIDYLIETKLKLSMLYSNTGLYLEAEETLTNIERKNLSKTLLPLYYEAYSQLYDAYAQSNNQHGYFSVNEAYRDSTLLAIDNQSMKYQIIYAEKMLYQGQIDIAEKHLLDIFNTTSKTDENYALVAYLLGNTYEQKGNIKLQEKYYTLSAISDIENATKDNASLQKLALTYYKAGEIELAYQFTKMALEDAVFCNVRFRTIEMSQLYTIIDETYNENIQKQKNELKLYLFLISILTFFLIIAVVYIYKQMKRVSGIRKEVYRANLKLQRVNEEISLTNHKLNDAIFELSESNKIKEEYIANFFDMCSSYINKLEDYRKILNKKASNNQLDELFKILKSNTLVETELEYLYRKFDSIFLSLYPNFVDEVNNLLLPEEKIILRPTEIMNTELRIFALIRLGITDSVKIASFLRYSISTIYNYRTKYRNKAAVSRDDFEKMIMKIGISKNK